MALQTTVGSRSVPGAATKQLLVVTGDAAYPTGGYVLNAQNFNLTLLRHVECAYFTTIAGGAYELVIVPTFYADGKTWASFALAFVVGATGAQVAAGTNMTAVSVAIFAEGN